ncbi:glutamate-5-semialdehyde dehydrogenase [Aquirufa rosea]|uniref:Gamma-glutamyl phosphate reductase n=1 Tax=Aquirufa rosea TaxID=2509241 RepID=A0A4Q1C0F6_9BACT|nr:glutamate-5-semialdehyde dehydrogenase [Aquirufa rosea]RXK49881.1 glutamate-5-semialdehyde dehydrogenase [Aquirufa rosea]
MENSSELLALLAETRHAAISLAMATSEQKNAILADLAQLLEANKLGVIQANTQDLAHYDAHNPMRDRLLLTEERIQSLADSLREIMLLPDPSGQVILEKQLANGLHLRKLAVPLGVVGVIYESRPNVTIDVAALCIRSGNAAVLRGGTDAWNSNSFLVSLIHHALEKNGFSKDLVRLLPTDRAYVSTLLTATKYIDVIIPRGSDALIQRVRRESLVPTIETGAGVCHTYVAETADLKKAVPVVVNAKVSRPSVCNSLDTIVIHASKLSSFLSLIQDDFIKYHVKIHADPRSYVLLKAQAYPYLMEAQEDDFGREFLDFACSIKVVDSTEEAILHISNYSSRHSEAIISEDAQEANYFLQAIDAAAVYWNASTRFTDGGVFDLGAEIGISTQKLHARGPFALEKLVTEKWVLVGDGQVR